MFTKYDSLEPEHGSSSAQIVNNLYERITSGQMESGTKLVETVLADSFKVSRGPVREALRHLASLGLVSFAPNRGASVRVISLTEAKALYEYRTALEAEAAYLAAQRIQAEGAQQLRLLLADHTSLVAASSDGAYVVKNRDSDFHSLVAFLSGSEYIIQALTKTLYPQLVLLRRQHKNVQGRGQVALKEHKRIAEAIQESDAELASLLMRRHLQCSWLSLEGQLLNQKKRNQENGLLD